ncbi:conserved hypothetical protein [Catenulispora acidiphila DSM 44928]|uniref:Integral membrane protein n=1 Tax=Catenulispora acidiphila (strain DSM 44928 / JCM 14897 / NBRC 102108 / NRRL B-24433 / ID139908) TaxID=479433 RepID=C7QBI3_CATAD|nr:DUF3159 domain-containing protein [Catenulispora acidiphila]ACU70560.1 conserved hypothetical protein [Catenulispora acidiphila DSM 44928]
MSLESGQRAEAMSRARHAAPDTEAGGDGVVLDAAQAERDAVAKQAETKAYEDAVKKAFGGKMGMADAGLPAICFLIVYTATNHLNPAVIGSVGVALLMFVIRLLRKETLQHALSGLFGVLVCAAFAKFSGHAQNYYLPGILINLGSFLLFAGTALVRWPIAGLMIGPITGEMTTWRQVPGRLRAFTKATWLLAGLFAVKLAVQVPLYLTHHTTALGVARLALGYPPYLACLYVAWQWIKNAPPPVMPETADGTAEVEAVTAAEGNNPA